jgi:hypothetical protein
VAYISGMGLPNHTLQSSSAPALSLAVPQRDASTEQLHEFVSKLPLSEFQKSEVTENEPLLRHFVTHFRIRSVDPTKENACRTFSDAYLEYSRNRNRSYFVNSTHWGRPPLMGALAEHNDDMVRELVDQGAKVDGDTISFASREGAPDPLVKFSFGAAVKHACNDTDFARLFDSLCFMAERNRPLAVACLEQQHLAAGRLTIHAAVWLGKAAVIPLFNDAGFDLDAGANGYTPLKVAFDNRDKLIAMALIRNGAKATAEVIDWLGARSTDGES